MAPGLETEHSARIENLPRFMAFIDEACELINAGPEATFAMRLAVEEVCINLIRYGYKDMAPGPIGLLLESEPGEIRLTIRDRARPFDPSQAPTPDLTSDIEERPIGGLGLFLIKQFIDEIDYRSDPVSGNQLTLVKRTPDAKGAKQGEERGAIG